MRISVVIPTLDRQDRLKHLIDSILANNTLPYEIVLIEQGDISRTQAVVDDYALRGVPIRAFYQEERSVSVARNRGAQESLGEVLIFLDDDMEIADTYIRIVADHFASHPKTVGATGSYMRGETAWTLKRIIGVFFCVYSWKARNVVLSSGSYDYIRGRNLDIEQSVEWLYGGNMIIRRSMFAQGFQFEPRFKRWSFGEDIMLTYRIHKKYPDSLRYLPLLVVAHLHGTEHKILNEEALRMKVIYRFVFWSREVWEGSTARLLAYGWSQIGLAGLELMQYPSSATLRTLLSSYWYLLHNWRAISTDGIDYNRFVFSELP